MFEAWDEACRDSILQRRASVTKSLIDEMEAQEKLRNMNTALEDQLVEFLGKLYELNQLPAQEEELEAKRELKRERRAARLRKLKLDEQVEAVKRRTELLRVELEEEELKNQIAEIRAAREQLKQEP